MLAEIGFLSLILSIVVAIYAIVVSVYAERTHNETLALSGRNAVWVNFAFMALSTGMLQYALVTQDYTVAYVWSVSSPDMPALFRWSAIWGSQAGSLLFWSFLMSLFAAVAVWLNWHSQRRLMPYAIAFMMISVVFFSGLTLIYENPFERWWMTPTGIDAMGMQEYDVISAALQPPGTVEPSNSRLAETAKGLNPLLRHFGMAFHPPALYLGFVGFLVPFAYAMAALASGDLTRDWIKASRRWTLVAWLFLSLGLILGGRWAYDVLGWGGYWGWDPVENAAFLPWLTGTAFLHSVMIQEKRGMLKLWNMVLVIGTFSAVIFGTFATRSGLVESVHSFARSEIGFPLFFFWFSLTLLGAGMILWRRSQGLLRDEHRFTSVFSRESLFVLNNIIFMALFVAVFWGSFGAPITSELFLNTNITLGVDYFNQVTPPLFLALFILMGIAPLSAWGATSVSRLGRALLMPFLLTLATLGLFMLNGMTSIGALIGYGIVSLGGWVAIYETFRGFQARQRVHKESPLASLRMLFARNPRRYGGYMIHLGVTVIGIGIIGSTLFQQETQQTLSVGESLSLGGYELRYDSFDGGQITQDGRILDIANVTVLRNGHEVAQLRPRRDFFPNGDMSTMTIAGAHSTLENDVYVLLVGWEPITAASVTFKVYINPLINLIWWGSFILILGTIFATWPKEIIPARTREALRTGDPSLAAARGA